jgi:hypothetical protein
MGSRSIPLMAAAFISGVCLTAHVVAQPGRVGTVKGRVLLKGTHPGNPVIRMGVDPMCVAAGAGRRAVQEVVVASEDGGLASVFVWLRGSFPTVPVPREHVVVDQRACIYRPRVTGARVGQVLEVRNSDPLFHNVRGVSRAGNSFNVGQPLAGMASQFPLTNEEVMLQIHCDVHRWMTAYVGVVSHPYFAVSGRDGSFEIRNVPVGAYSIQTWHERYGTLTYAVRVAAGAVTPVSVEYPSTGKVPPG